MTIDEEIDSLEKTIFKLKTTQKLITEADTESTLHHLTLMELRILHNMRRVMYRLETEVENTRDVQHFHPVPRHNDE